MPKKKDGTKITWKEFFQLWKSGIELITPVQKMQNEVRANFTMLIGYIIGLLALIIKFNLIPNKILSIALIIIFFGASWSNGIKWLALRQQLKLFKNFDSNAIDLNKIMDNLEDEKEEPFDVDKIEEKYVEDLKDEDLKGGNENGSNI